MMEWSSEGIETGERREAVLSQQLRDGRLAGLLALQMYEV
jgi:hypothetical protein